MKRAPEGSGQAMRVPSHTLVAEALAQAQREMTRLASSPESSSGQAMWQLKNKF